MIQQCGKCKLIKRLGADRWDTWVKISEDLVEIFKDLKDAGRVIEIICPACKGQEAKCL